MLARKPVPNNNLNVACVKYHCVVNIWINKTLAVVISPPTPYPRAPLMRVSLQAEMALKSEGFVDIDMSTLESVLGRETLNCKEMYLLEAALNWAAAECARREIEATPQNKRAVLGSALYLVRIPTMTLEEFANGAAQIGILTHEETINIFLHFTANNKPALQYPVKARAGLKSQVLSSFLYL